MLGEYEPNDSRNVTGMSDQGMGTPGGADQQLGAERWGGDARKARQMEQRQMEERQQNQIEPDQEGAEVHFIADARLNDALSDQQVQFESTSGGQMEASEAASQIREHMEVIGADGVHVGTVDAVEGHRIKLTRNDSGMGSSGMESHAGHHHYLSIGLVAEVEGDRVRLSANGAVAYEMLQEE